MPGHDSGHDVPPPVGFDWDAYVLAFVEEHGGWAALCDELIRRAPRAEEFPSDPQVVEKGLRRLAKRGSRSGGQYGRWLIRYFGIPSSLSRWAQWMGQLHSRFSDLPSSLRWEQLSLWDRPPVTESRIAAWIHVGIASVLLRMQHDDDAQQRLVMAERGAEQAGVACRMEVALLRAKLLTDDGQRAESEALFDAVEQWLASDELSLEDRRCYHARLVGQRAYHLTREAPGYPGDLQGALALFESIADEPFIPFVAFRKSNGLAYCHWKLGDAALGTHWARLAEQHAGDGGFVRFRIMALNLQARMLPSMKLLLYAHGRSGWRSCSKTRTCFGACALAGECARATDVRRLRRCERHDTLCGERLRRERASQPVRLPTKQATIRVSGNTSALRARRIV